MAMPRLGESRMSAEATTAGLFDWARHMAEADQCFQELFAKKVSLTYEPKDLVVEVGSARIVVNQNEQSVIIDGNQLQHVSAVHVTCKPHHLPQVSVEMQIP